jgi:hypothetical protein
MLTRVTGKQTRNKTVQKAKPTRPTNDKLTTRGQNKQKFQNQQSKKQNQHAKQTCKKTKKKAKKQSKSKSKAKAKKKCRTNAAYQAVVVLSFL